ncbi:MAG: DUF488 domain-containing protein [Candidatus Pacearchaeota archaeon]|nr:DUF488 domain-containing protein [Candidatus Pacearchaeota archaeon]
MKLQKQSSRKKDDPNYEKYIKWVLVIPTDRINQLGWKEGQEVKDEIKGNNLIVSSVSEKNNSENKEEVLYEEFKNSIKNILERHPSGLTWSQIRDKLNLPQKYPNNLWVRKMEKEIGLARIKIGNVSYWNFENDSIYTIGYEGYTIEKFIKKLKDSNIQQLIDVREIALSRKNGFSKSILTSELKKEGIIYRHLPELGSPKEIRHQLYQDWDYEKFFKEYQKHINDEDVMQNISIIEGLAKRRKSVLMCFEKDFKKCHRSIIADELKRKSWRVSHL